MTPNPSREQRRSLTRTTALLPIMYIMVYMKAITITDRQSIAEARRNLPSLIREAESGNAVELTRRGESVAVLISCQVFERLATSHRSFDDAYRAFSDSVGLAEMELDPGELFGHLRDTVPGRDVRL